MYSDDEITITQPFVNEFSIYVEPLDRDITLRFYGNHYYSTYYDQDMLESIMVEIDGVEYGELDLDRL